MLPSVTILQQLGLAVLAVAVVVWIVGLVRVVRRDRAEASPWTGAQDLLSSVPRQTDPAGPEREAVNLSEAERETFEGLVRNLAGRR